MVDLGKGTHFSQTFSNLFCVAHSKSFCCDFFSSVLLLLVYGDVSLTAISHFTYTNGMRGQQQEQQQKHGERGRSIKYIISPLEASDSLL